MAYRPPGRHNRSGRVTADNDVFEGLPVKQWGHQSTHVSFVPPKAEIEVQQHDRWADPPMPRDYQLLQPWTQHLLRLARGGKVGTKRKQDTEPQEEEKPEEPPAEETKHLREERGYSARRWKPVPEALLEPEHKHLEFLAKRRKGLPILYGPDVQAAAAVPMRKTKVQRTDAVGGVAVYEVLVPEGQSVAGEVKEAAELANVTPVAAAPGTVIEGVGVANDQGILVAEHLKPSLAPRRNRPPPKKKGGPGRGKKRVTFTNPDGSTYTTVVPNATKIVPQPGQTVKHVAKGETATADVAARDPAQTGTGTGEHAEGEEQEGEEGDEEGDDDGDDDDDDDREEGEVTEDEANTTTATPVPSERIGVADAVSSTSATTQERPAPKHAPSTLDTPLVSVPALPAMETAPLDASVPVVVNIIPAARDGPFSSDLPLATESPSRQASRGDHAAITTDAGDRQTKIEDEAAAGSTVEALPVADVAAVNASARAAAAVSDAVEPPADAVTALATLEPESERLTGKFDDGEEDLLGSLERSLRAPDNLKSEGQPEASAQVFDAPTRSETGVGEDAKVETSVGEPKEQEQTETVDGAKAAGEDTEMSNSVAP